MYAATLAHYVVVADPARVRDPNRKGKRFESIEAQNEPLERWEMRSR